MTIPPLLIFIGSYLGISWGIYRLFKEAGNTVNDEVKIATSLWLLNLGEKKTLNWPSQFIELFDRVFTKNHFSLKCLQRSAVASMISVLLVSSFYYMVSFKENLARFKLEQEITRRLNKFKQETVKPLNKIRDLYEKLQIHTILYGVRRQDTVSYYFYPDFLPSPSELENSYYTDSVSIDSIFLYYKQEADSIILEFERSRDSLLNELILKDSIIASKIIFEVDYADTYFEFQLEESPNPVKEVISIISFFVFLNLIVDFLSLLETRNILSKMRLTSSVFKHLLLLALDVFLTALIFYLLIWIMFIFFPELVGIESIDFFKRIRDVGDTLSLNDPIGVLLYTTFFTSIWVWLYFLSGLIIKGINLTKTGLAFFKNTWNIEEKPFQSMGFIIVCLVTICYVIWGMLLIV